MKQNIKEIIGFIIFSIINIIIAYDITTALGIKDVILYKTITATTGDITYEVIIWWFLTFIEALIYEKITQKNSEVF